MGGAPHIPVQGRRERAQSREPEPRVRCSIYISLCRLTPQTEMMYSRVNPISSWNLMPDLIFPWMLIYNELKQKYRLPQRKRSKQLLAGTPGSAE